VGFELFVHPDNAERFWSLLLEKGKPFGITPCGLAARDSTRIEAGLPLYGHELSGVYNMTPAEAGFPGYVKYHKPFFIGRDVLLKKDMERNRELIRWRIEKKGVRRPNPEDPVVNKNGIVIGNVTSCSIDASGLLMGLALVQKKYALEGSEIAIYVKPAGKRGEPSADAAKPGDKLTLPIPALVLPRFMG
jgi:glycine hydroxymethyltransferase